MILLCIKDIQYNAVSNIRCISNTLAQLLLALNAADILQASLKQWEHNVVNFWVSYTAKKTSVASTDAIAGVW